MKWTGQEALQEVLRRSEKIEKERVRRRKAQQLSLLLLALCIGLTGTIASFSGTGAIRESESVYGAFLIPSQAGGYILVAVLAFAIGVVATLLAQKHKKK